MQAITREIFKGLNRRFFVLRLLEFLIPLACCLAFSGGAGFLLVRAYAESAGENFARPGAFPGEIFRPHIPLLVCGGIIFFCLLTGIVFLVHALLNRALLKTIRRPLKDLTEGFERLHAGEQGVTLPPGDGIFRPLYAAFNRAAGSAGEDPRPSLALIRAGLEGFEAALHIPQGDRTGPSPVLERLATLKRLLDQRIFLAGMDQGDFPMSPETLELGRFLGDLARELSEEYRGRGLNLGFKEYRDPLKITVDPLWLRSVVAHLVDNSARHKRLERGTAMIRYRRREGAGEPSPGLAEITVTDNGPGLPAEALPLIFEGRSGPLPGLEGRGLGLAITARIVKFLGGGIYGERPRRGGLSVVLCFPTAAEP